MALKIEKLKTRLFPGPVQITGTLFGVHVSLSCRILYSILCCYYITVDNHVTFIDIIIRRLESANLFVIVFVKALWAIGAFYPRNRRVPRVLACKITIGSIEISYVKNLINSSPDKTTNQYKGKVSSKESVQMSGEGLQDHWSSDLK